MKKLKQLILIFALFLLHSCNSNSSIESQIKSDLTGMLQNKARVKNIEVKKISTEIHQTKKIIFDCTLEFTDNLYKDDGALAFTKGMVITEKNNSFTYEQTGSSHKLIELEFGQTVLISDK
ncbi:hypothetical protein [Ferruginibacter sp.]